MKKLALGIILTVACLFLVNSANALILAWDSYSDPEAEVLRIWYSTTESGEYTLLRDDIPKTAVSAEIPDHSTSERVYYRMTAINKSTNESSSYSNAVSYYWYGSGGGGTHGVSPPGGLSLIDCSTENFDNLSTEQQGLCLDAHPLSEQ